MIRRAPAGLVVAAAVAVTLLGIPLVSMLWRVPWSDTWRLLTSPDSLTALRLSLVTSSCATVVALVLGVPLAWVQARVEYRGRSVVRALTMLPMVLPPVVGGVALLLAFGRRGLVGQWLDRWFGIRLPFSTAGVVLAEAFVAMPFLLLAVEAGFRSVDTGLEDAARTLGARPWTVFRRVTLPLVRPALVAGTALCWARAIGEFGATITFAGNVRGRTETMPLAIYLALQNDPRAAVVLGLLLLAVSVIVLGLMRNRWMGART